MLADPAYCDLVQNIGVASLGADEKQIWHLTKLYWFTVEFGVVREEGQVKGFGAGVLSSYGELQHMASGVFLDAMHPSGFAPLKPDAPLWPCTPQPMYAFAQAPLDPCHKSCLSVQQRKLCVNTENY